MVMLVVGCVEEERESSVEAGEVDVAVRDAGDLADVPPPAPDQDASDRERDPGCVADQARCSGAGLRQSCVEGRWRDEPCEVGFHCRDGGCEETCKDGARRCTEAGEARCEAEHWSAPVSCGLGRCLGGRCRTEACALAFEQPSHVGCEFVTVDLPNAAPDPMALLILNPDPDAAARVHLRDRRGRLSTVIASHRFDPSPRQERPEPQTLTSRVLDAEGRMVSENIEEADALVIPPGGRARLLLEHLALPNHTTGLRDIARQLTSDTPIVVNQLDPACCDFRGSSDSSLLFPVEAWGSSYRTVAAGAQVLAGLRRRAQIVVVPAEPARITFEIAPGHATLPTDGFAVRVIDGVYVAQVRAFESLVIFSTGEGNLGGGRLESDVPVAVFMGHQCARFPLGTTGCDHLEEQQLPLWAWGTRVVVPPLSAIATAGPDVTYWTLTASVPGTPVRLSRPFEELAPLSLNDRHSVDCAHALTDPQSLSLDKCVFGTRAAFTLVAEGPIQVLGFSPGALAPNRRGMASAALLPAERHYRDTYEFIVPHGFPYSYATVTMPPGLTLLLDGAPAEPSRRAGIAGSEWVYAHIPLEEGSHQLMGDAPFGLVLHGTAMAFASHAHLGGAALGDAAPVP